MRKTLYAVLFAIPLLFAASGVGYAWQETFSGTRDQLRAACAVVSGDLVDGEGSTYCLNHKNGTGITCADDGKCDGNGAGPAPSVRIGAMDVVGVMVGL